MSMWNKLITHPSFDRIKTVYNDQFPLEVRFVCAYWIEERMKEERNIDINHPQIKETATNFLHALIQQLIHDKQKFMRAEQLSIQYRLDAAIEILRNHLHNSFVVYKQIRDTISYEEHLVGNYENGVTCMDEEAIEITQRLNILKNDVLTHKDKLAIYKHELENYKVLEYRELLTQTIQVNNALEQERRLAILEDYQRRKNEIIATINVRSIDLNQNIAKMIFQIDSVQKLLINNRLNKWRRDQALAGNGASLNENCLDEIQWWFEKLAEIIWTVRCSIEAIREINSSVSLSADDATEQYFKDVTTLLQNLIESGFIVEKQPPQVLKTDVKFTATVRLLTANLGIQLNNPSIFVALYLERQPRLNSRNCQILNNTGKLDIQTSTNHLSCSFNNMKLKKFKRTEKKEGASVTDEKYALIFKSTFRTTADIEINVSVITLPVVIIVHTYQEPQAWGTITWDNAFSQICREPFQVTDTVSWSHFADALNMKFTSETEKRLTPACLQYLYEKAFGTNVDDNDRLISWTHFCKAPLPERMFSFWEWFYSVMKLIKNHIHGAWTDGSIVGFIDKRKAIETLQHCQTGTFLVRFSESEPGGICIFWADQTSPTSVIMLEPFFSEDLKIRSLADRIRDLDQCTTLYPNIPKDVGFQKYYSPAINSTVNGYVRVVLKTTIPNAISSHVCNCKANVLQLPLEDTYGDPAELFDFLSS